MKTTKNSWWRKLIQNYQTITMFTYKLLRMIKYWLNQKKNCRNQKYYLCYYHYQMILITTLFEGMKKTATAEMTGILRSYFKKKFYFKNAGRFWEDRDVVFNVYFSKVEIILCGCVLKSAVNKNVGLPTVIPNVPHSHHHPRP